MDPLPIKPPLFTKMIFFDQLPQAVTSLDTGGFMTLHNDKRNRVVIVAADKGFWLFKFTRGVENTGLEETATRAKTPEDYSRLPRFKLIFGHFVMGESKPSSATLPSVYQTLKAVKPTLHEFMAQLRSKGGSVRGILYIGDTDINSPSSFTQALLTMVKRITGDQVEPTYMQMDPAENPSALSHIFGLNYFQHTEQGRANLIITAAHGTKVAQLVMPAGKTGQEESQFDDLFEMLQPCDELGEDPSAEPMDTEEDNDLDDETGDHPSHVTMSLANDKSPNPSSMRWSRTQPGKLTFDNGNGQQGAHNSMVFLVMTFYGLWGLPVSKDWAKQNKLTTTSDREF
ncbi:hypothetical protein N7492_009860 [Penicillium capsulatum]|uniref:Uncharacterized protein n=1 Tax=Penicillium capsulatum TaxID=69766 RepID=A0A9W9LEW2_9EURO|nr:hypothetical protein N7492_009860 [Penicillium capsulatum]